MIGRKTDNLKYEFLPAALEITETPPNKFSQAVLWILVALIVTVLAWSYFGHIDIVATARGKIIPDGNVKIVQSSAGGVVTAISVSDGDTVKKGDLMVKFDTAILQGDVDTLEKSLATARLERDVTRMIAANQDPTQIINESSAPEEAKEDLRALASSRASSYQVQRQFATIGVDQASSQLARESTNLANARNNLATAQQNQRAIQAAFDQATGADRASLQTQLSYANSVVSSASETVNTMQDRINSAQSALRQAQSSLAELDGSISDGALGTVVDQNNTIAQIESELEKAKKNIEDQSVYAPVDGKVMSLAVNTIGNVVGSGQQLAIIVPTDTPLTIEASLQNQDIGFVHVGQRVAIKVDSFSFQRYGILEGEVESISPDAIQNESNGALTYKIRVKIKSNESSKERAIPLQSGMSITSEIKTGNRRIISFFLDPLLSGMDESFKVR